MKRVRQSSHAEADIVAAIKYLRQKSPEAAIGFVTALELAIKRIARFPELAPMQWRSKRSELVNARCSVIRRFGYLIYYNNAVDSVLILRIVHGSQNEP